MQTDWKSKVILNHHLDLVVAAQTGRVGLGIQRLVEIRVGVGQQVVDGAGNGGGNAGGVLLLGKLHGQIAVAVAQLLGNGRLAQRLM